MPEGVRHLYKWHKRLRNKSGETMNGPQSLLPRTVLDFQKLYRYEFELWEVEALFECDTIALNVLHEGFKLR